MPLVQRSRPQIPSQSLGNSGNEPKAPNGSGSGRLLSQTRLDRIAAPTATFHLAFSRWFLRLTGDRETYTAAKMKAYLQDKLGPRVARLRIQVARPQASLTAEEWETLEDELRRAEGKAAALSQVLETRIAEAGASLPPRARERRLNLRARASEPASPSTTTPDPFDVFEGE